jgi:hypothetical protein
MKMGFLNSFKAMFSIKICRCSYPDRCQIAIPDVSMIGIRCQPTTQFCCRARAVIKPYLNPSDWAELFAAVKRLKVEQQVSQFSEF